MRSLNKGFGKISQDIEFVSINVGVVVEELIVDRLAIVLSDTNGGFDFLCPRKASFFVVATPLKKPIV